MRYSPLGVSHVTKELLSEPLDGDTLTPKIIKIKDMDNELRGGGKGMGDAATHIRNTDPSIKWGYIVEENDPHQSEYEEILKPLTDYYEMDKANYPLPFWAKESHEWDKWINDEYKTLNRAIRANYLLIVGDPEQIPFGFQSQLNYEAHTGRVCFDTLDELDSYVKKVAKFYAEPPHLERKATIFATNFGGKPDDYDPTYYSYNQLVKPLSESLKLYGVEPDITAEKDATKEKMVEKLSKSKSALVFIASHGMGDIKGEQRQREITGAICTQNWNKSRADDDLFAAKDIPDEETSFLEGSVFFQFSCYGYGTPRYNDIVNFSNSQSEKQIAEKALVAAIPKKLLAHPKGPVAFIGHANETYLECFYKDDIAIPPKKRAKIDEYDSMLSNIFVKNTIGISMYDLNKRCARESGTFTTNINRYKPQEPDSELNEVINGSYLAYHDMKNFLLFGDPALKLSSIGA